MKRHGHMRKATFFLVALIAGPGVAPFQPGASAAAGEDAPDLHALALTDRGAFAERAPFAVFAADAEGRLTENRTSFYVIDGFDRLYGEQLRSLPAWPDWVRLVDELDDKALGAFRGEIDLHESRAQIESLAATYDRLRQQHSARSARD